VKRFEDKVDRSGGPDACHMWMACIAKEGYGRFGLNGETRNTHRIAWEMAFGPVPEGLCVLHRCDVRACVNPGHLFLGTKKDNTADMLSKGRNRNGAKKGSSNGRAKLTEKQVMTIRWAYENTKLSHDQLGKIFGVSGAKVWQIVKRKAWGHV
jgi:hypothetical protein